MGYNKNKYNNNVSTVGGGLCEPTNQPEFCLPVQNTSVSRVGM